VELTHCDDLGANNHAVRGARYRYIRHPNGEQQSYDQQHDPDEVENLADRVDRADRAVRAELAPVKKRLGQWLPKTNATVV